LEPCIAAARGYCFPNQPNRLRRETRLGAAIPGETMNQQHERRSGWSWWYLLLVIQFVASLWVSFYNRLDPTWIGIPFFYWYQMLWVIIGAILTAIVYFATED
jgi:Protein of unknown function (DUF3311)